ncbi:MAG TPA: ammonia-forming cytochrome c nitrite reductase subunit c552, partial [Ignavibacteria bacterium]|nr:ammonia-forming cytochrome c nitrite reductase subunit c552 [Ignavibacteria bacterium]
VLVKHGVSYPIAMPDVSTKAKAQKYIGLDMEKLRKEKHELLNTSAKEWDRIAKERQGTLIEY